MSGDEPQRHPPGGAPGVHPWLGGLFLVAGVGLFLWLVVRLDIGTAEIGHAFGRIGWWFAAILALALVRFGLRTAAWLALANRPVPFSSALAATISGDAIGNVMLLGFAASEPAKAMYLRRRVDPASSLAVLAAENFFYSVSVALFVILAAGALLLFFDHLDPAVHLAGVLALGSMGAVLAGAAWMAWQKPTLASALLARLPIPWLGARVERVRVFEQNSYGAAGPGARRLAVVAVCEAGFHLASFVECWLVFWLLTGETALTPALIYDGFNRVVNVLFKMIPARAGVEEGGTAFLAEAIGYTRADGFLLAIVRKVRMLVFAGIGMALSVRNSRRG